MLYLQSEREMSFFGRISVYRLVILLLHCDLLAALCLDALDIIHYTVHSELNIETEGQLLKSRYCIHDFMKGYEI